MYEDLINLFLLLSADVISKSPDNPKKWTTMVVSRVCLVSFVCVMSIINNK